MAVLRRAVELDINFIDTADSHGPYVSEELIAEVLFPYPIWSELGRLQTAQAHRASPTQVALAGCCGDLS